MVLAQFQLVGVEVLVLFQAFQVLGGFSNSSKDLYSMGLNVLRTGAQVKTAEEGFCFWVALEQSGEETRDWYACNPIDFPDNEKQKDTNDTA